MKLTSLSASRIKTWQRCKFQYFLQYVARIDLGTNWGARHGTAIHSVLEEYAKGNRCWEKELLKEYLHVDKEIGTTILGHAKKVDYGDIKQKCSSCPLYEDGFCGLEGCPVVKIDGCGRLLWGRSKRLLEKYLDEHAYIYDRPILGIEKHFKLSIDHRDVIGIIDFIYEMQDGTIHMIDYKTSKKWEPSQNYKAMKKDIQAKLYAWAMSEMFPDKNCMLTFFFFMNRPITLWYNKAEIESIRAELSGIWDEIVAFEERYANRIIDSGYGRIPNECRYLCDMGVCEKEWKKFKNGNQMG